MAYKRIMARQVILFGIVGIVTLGIDVIVTKSVYQFLDLPAYMASAIGFLSGFFFNFPMNRNRVFSHSLQDRFTVEYQIVMVLLLSLFNLIFTSLFVDRMVRLGLLDIAIAKIIATLIIAAWNFLIFKWFIFSKKD